MTLNETVLCIRRNQLPASWIQTISILPMDLDQFIQVCTKAQFEFISRPKAELDINTKQIIPYIILQSDDRQKTALYHRHGSEKRLHDLWSIGIGGHINPVDQTNEAPGFEQILMNGLKRELDEEITQRPAGDSMSFVGIISEEETEVGRVHLGAVFRLSTSTPESYVPGPELSRFKWELTENLDQFNLELWSELSLKLISHG